MRRTGRIVVSLLLAVVTLHCSESANEHPEDSPRARFTEPGTGYSTTELLDASGDTFWVDLKARRLMLPDGVVFERWSAEDLMLIYDDRLSFQVRFGSAGGERHGYITEIDPFLCDLQVVAGKLKIVPTKQPLPAAD